MESLRIAIVRSTLHKGSGQTRHIYEIASRLIKMGHEVLIFARKTEVNLLPLPIYKVKFSLAKIPFLRHFGLTVKIGALIKGFDLVHTQYHPDIFVGNYAKSLYGIPHVFTYHGFAPIKFWMNPLQKLKMIDHRVGTFLAVKFALNHIITVSKFLKKELISFYRFPDQKISVIYNGVDTERFNPKVDGLRLREKLNIGKNPVVLYLGRLAPYKGINYFIKAIPYVLKQIPSAKFLTAGSIRYDAPRVHELINKLGVKKSLIFLGHIPDDELPQVYATCDVFCYPSLWEGFGIPPIEAQACGKPVVAFNHCALPEVISNNETGILVPARDYVGLAKAIVDLILDEDKRIEMGRKAREKVEKVFSWDLAAEKTIKVYLQAINKTVSKS
jgi:1,2-diacylglycerol 3-alpha-glucosyltransferase